MVICMADTHTATTPEIVTYPDYFAYRDMVLETSSPLRLDENDPFSTMDYMRRAFVAASAEISQNNYVPELSAQAAKDLWAITTGMQAARDNVIATSGVRASLQSLFAHYAQAGTQVWLPQDVYAFYWDQAELHGLQPRSFTTLPKPDFTPLQDAAAADVALISNPVSPLGRYLNEAEVEQLGAWLAGSDQRRLVIEGVYGYQPELHVSTRTLYKNGQVLVAHSLSKAWLERGVYGVLLAPEADKAVLEQFMQKPSPAASLAALTALQRAQDLPDAQQRAFQHKWEQLRPALQAIDPAFQPPESGYLAAINGNHADILARHSALVLPARLFGSRNPDLSVASCLYGMK